MLSFQYPYHKIKYTWFDVSVFPFSGKNKGGLTRFFVHKRIYTVLTDIHRTSKITGILSFWCTECAWVGKKFADKHNLKHKIWIMGQDARADNYYVKKIKPAPAELAALSDFLQDEFEKNHAIRPEYVVPPGIDATEYPEKNVLRDIDIFGAGSLISLKQFSVFLKVVAEIKKELPTVKVVLHGKGPEKNKLKQAIKKLELEDNVDLAGEVPHSDLLVQMKRAKVFLHPSSYEGFSGVCQEALHAGVHVVSFCYAMNHPIDQWHIVFDKKEMIKKTKQILQNQSAEFKQVTPYLAEDSVRKIMKLFSGD